MVTRVIQYFRFPDKPMKSGETSWISRKGGKGILEKRGGGRGWSRKGGYVPAYQLWVVPYFIFYMSSLYGYGHKNPGGHLLIMIFSRGFYLKPWLKVYFSTAQGVVNLNSYRFYLFLGGRLNFFSDHFFWGIALSDLIPSRESMSQTTILSRA